MKSIIQPEISRTYKTITKLTINRDKCSIRIPKSILAFYRDIKLKSSLDYMKDYSKNKFLTEMELPLSIDALREITKEIEEGKRIMPLLVIFKRESEKVL